MKKFVRSKYLSMKCVKKLLYVVSGLGILVACQQEPGYRIIGSIPGTPDGMKVYLYDWNIPVDSSVVKDGKYQSFRYFSV